MDSERYVTGALRASWFAKAAYAPKGYKEAIKNFNKKAIPKLIRLINTREEAIVAVKILLDLIEVDYEDIKFEEMDFGQISLGAYSRHTHLSPFNNKDLIYKVANEIKTNRAVELLNDTEKFKQMIKERLNNR